VEVYNFGTLGLTYRTEKDDAVLHQLLLCLKALSTTQARFSIRTSLIVGWPISVIQFCIDSIPSVDKQPLLRQTTLRILNPSPHSNPPTYLSPTLISSTNCSGPSNCECKLRNSHHPPPPPFRPRPNQTARLSTPLLHPPSLQKMVCRNKLHLPRHLLDLPTRQKHNPCSGTISPRRIPTHRQDHRQRTQRL